MPRVELDPKKRMLKKLLNFIVSEMREQGVTQADMAYEIGVSSQSALSQKFKAGRFSIVEIIAMLSVLGITIKDLEEIGL